MNPHLPGRGGAIGPLSAINGRSGVDASPPVPISPPLSLPHIQSPVDQPYKDPKPFGRGPKLGGPNTLGIGDLFCR
eukprot:9207238-Pyramimonas_sp.AAC.1